MCVLGVCCSAAGCCGHKVHPVGPTMWLRTCPQLCTPHRCPTGCCTVKWHCTKVPTNSHAWFSHSCAGQLHRRGLGRCKRCPTSNCTLTSVPTGCKQMDPKTCVTHQGRLYAAGVYRLPASGTSASRRSVQGSPMSTHVMRVSSHVEGTAHAGPS